MSTGVPVRRLVPVRGLASSRAWALLVAAGAVLALVAGPGHRWAAVVAGVTVLVGSLPQLLVLALQHRRGRSADYRLPLRAAVALVLAVGAWCWLARPEQPVVPVVVVVAALAVVALNLPAHRAPRPDLQAAHLPGAPSPSPASPSPPAPSRWPAWRLAGALLLLLLVIALGVATGLPGAAVAGLAVLLGLGLVLAGTAQRRASRAQADVRRALAALAPVWLMPYNGSATFHVGMWAPYLLRTGRPLLVVTTSPLSFERLAAAYDLPVLHVPAATSESLAQLLPASVRAAFYVYNGWNRVFLRVPGVRHVFLQHGDSDKAGSASPVSLEYDTIVVAGQAGIDRFAAQGLAPAPGRFVVLGRPQTEEIERARRPVGEVASPVVLYAPTWKGKSEELNYSSLLLGPRIVRALLKLGAVVVFRPHPAGRSYRPHVRAITRIQAMLEADAARTGRPHRWGPAAEGLSVAEAANLSDAMVSDISGIVTDHLQSLKPYAMVSTREPAAAFREHVPTSRAAYVLEPDLAGLTSTLRQMLGPDPLAAARAERRSYYLGEADGRASAAAFVAWVDSLAGPPTSP